MGKKVPLPEQAPISGFFATVESLATVFPRIATAEGDTTLNFGWVDKKPVLRVDAGDVDAFFERVRTFYDGSQIVEESELASFEKRVRHAAVATGPSPITF